jgi:hypothetical protein
MAQLIVPNGAQVKLKWLVAGTPMLTVLGASGTNTVAVTQTLANTIGAGVKSAFTSSGYAGCVGISAALEKVSVRDVKGPNQPEFEDTGAAVAGTNADTDFLPKNVALVVTYKTLLAGKSYRGRSYLPALMEADSEFAGTIDQACVDAGIAFITAIEAVFSGSGLSHAVLSPALPSRTTAAGDTLPPKAAFATNVTSVTSRSNIPGSQRRRLHRP